MTSQFDRLLQAHQLLVQAHDQVADITDELMDYDLATAMVSLEIQETITSTELAISRLMRLVPDGYRD